MKNASGRYQPQDIVEYWFETGEQTGAMISDITSPIDTQNMSKPQPSTGQYEVYSSFDVPNGTWSNSPVPIQLKTGKSA